MPTSHPLAGEPDPESLLTCPYNASHRVARKRIQFHLTKCRKGHPNAKKEVCPFNATHMVNEQEFRFHLEICPSKGIIDNFKYVTPNENHVIELPPDPVVPPAEENWDNDYSGTYDPAAKVADKAIIHTFIGGTRSERKKCRVQQRQKFRALDGTVPSVKVEPQIIEKKHLPDDQPLRQPISLPTTFPSSSAKFASLNCSLASGISEAGRSTSTVQEKPCGVLNKDRKEGPAVALRNSVVGSAWAQNTPGPSQDDDDDDGFIVFKPKGRGKFMN